MLWPLLTLFSFGKGHVKKSSEEAILTPKGGGRNLKVAEKTIYRLVGTKKIPAFKVGGAWRFSRADIDQWIKQQTITTDKND
ncbi:MAG: helix-turn-helix domain-containing protein [Rhodocyclaceae bacterium]|nr:helix-turn-helix domain-containing protein [Rhodocyclaceae bacterium]